MPTQDTVFMAALFFVVAALVIIPVAAAIGWRKATTGRRPRLLARRPRRFWVLWGAGMELFVLSEFNLLAMHRPLPTLMPWVAAGLASVRTIPRNAEDVILFTAIILVFVALGST